VQWIARIGVVVLLAYAAFQAALAAGAPLGHLAWGGAHRVLPRGLRIASGVALVFYVCAAAALAAVAGLPSPWPGAPARWLLLALTVLFGVGVPMNLASRSAPERWHALGALTITVACLSAFRLEGA
jgi:hypothetical protein